MRRTMKKRVGKIAARAGQQDQNTTKPCTQHASHRTEEQSGGDSIAYGMDNIGVQGESGHSTPELTVKHTVSIRTAALEPCHVRHPYEGDGKEYQNEYASNGTPAQHA